MSSLRQLDASSNCISSLLPLAPLAGLSQLSVEANHLTSLAGLASMTGLLELYVAHNAVADIKVGPACALHPLLLQCLSCSAACLRGSFIAWCPTFVLKKQSNVLLLSFLQEAERLSVLPLLVILDLEGNPLVAAAEDYKHLLLYRLRHLKVLDGAPATAADLAAARAKYSGRLTMSFLVRCLLCLLPCCYAFCWL
jgi:hypothetical protein